MPETNPAQTEFPVTIAGKKFILSYPIEAFWALEDISKNQNLTQGITPEDLHKMSMRERVGLTVDMLWAGLTTRHPDITREAVETMVKKLFFSDLKLVEQVMFMAFAASLPKADPAAAAGGQEPGGGSDPQPASAVN